MSAQHEVRIDPEYGFLRLFPVPNEEEIGRFYQSKYYELILHGGRAPEIQRLLSGGPEAEAERKWIQDTVYADLCHVLRQHISGNRVLDIGCGSGEFLAYAQQTGFIGLGLDLSQDAVDVARQRGLRVFPYFVNELPTKLPQEPPFDAVVMLNVLEHAPDPADLLNAVRRVLRPGGTICVRVPNDFSPLQEAAAAALDVPPWWVLAPDHINYFNFQTLPAFMGRMGFKTLHLTTDFPMEMFLLMRENYTNDPETGKLCHQKRVAFESSLPPETRRGLYAALAAAGCGRSCVYFGELS